jgi:hypothetical protein
MEALSMTMTEFGAGNGLILSRRMSMKEVNVSVVNEQSTTSRCRMPSRDRAGSMEYLEDGEVALTMVDDSDSEDEPISANEEVTTPSTATEPSPSIATLRYIAVYVRLVDKN